MKGLKSTVWGLAIILMLAVALAFATDVKDQMSFQSKQVPQISISNGDQEQGDTQISWLGNAQTYHSCLDDSADDLIIVGKGAACGTDPLLSFTNDDSATASDKTVIQGNTSETNGTVDVFQVKLDTSGTAANNLGMGISFQMDDATGLEERASIDIIETTAARATNDTDIVINQDINGTMTERMRLDADGSVVIVPAGSTLKLTEGTVAAMPACAAGTTGTIGYVTFEDYLCFCNGTNYIRADDGTTCTDS